MNNAFNGLVSKPDDFEVRIHELEEKSNKFPNLKCKEKKLKNFKNPNKMNIPKLWRTISKKSDLT